MFELVKGLITSLAVGLSPLWSQVLGSATLDYPFTFSESGFTCEYFEQCYMHCHHEYQEQGLDKQECQTHFPDAWPPDTTAPSPTPMLMPTETPAPSPTQEPMTQPGDDDGGLEPSVTPYSDTTLEPTSTTDADDEMGDEYVQKKVRPELVTLVPGQKVKFYLVSVFPDGTEVGDNPAEVNWQVKRGGGVITSDGIFTASHNVGFYEHTVLGSANGQYARATVKIIEATVTPRPTDVPEEHEEGSTGEEVEETTSEPTKMFEYINERVDECLRNSYTPDQYQKYFAADGELRNLYELGDEINRAKACMRLRRIPDFAAEEEACLKEALGEARFSAIYSGQAEATDAELEKARICFDKPNVVNYTAYKKPDAATLSCLKLSLGEDRFAKIETGEERPTRKEIASARECLNVTTQAAAPPMVVQSTEEQSSCVDEAIDNKRLQDLIEGKKRPTLEEKAAIKQCFEIESSVQTAFLPVPPEQVVFIDEAAEEVEIESAKTNNRIDTNVLLLQGKAYPDSIVDVYLFSDPIVISTTADENGNWSYELSYHLPEGGHHAYTVIQHPEKGLVRSEVFSIDVAYAAEEINPQLAESLIVTPQLHQSRRNYFMAAAAVVLLALGAILMVFRTKFAYLMQNNSQGKVASPADEMIEIKSESTD